ncbi:MAG: glycosyltransferase family 2 protein [Clostridia bacterium]|nr:glycosyltransferase family 2 protein [Clostridia bacterium]
MAKITVFTPAYNRAHTIERTYKSLCEQTCKDFIWMVIDDGSTDNTAELVKKWQTADNGFEIEYYYKKNGGMHTAHNLAYEKIKTELNVCIDSDDGMPETAVEDILNFWKENGSKDVAGIVALDSDFDGNVLGTRLPKGVKIASTEDVYSKYHCTGDKKFIYRTEIINSVAPYPEFEGEKLVALGYKYTLVADNYDMLLMDKVVCLVDYQIDGSSNTIFKQYLQSPRGFAAGKILRMTRTKSRRDRIKTIAHYIAECRIAKDKDWLKNSPYKIRTVLFYPLGFALEKYIRYVNRKLK